ncbi:MFS transporter, FHS family, glucose/mannose:H+ symporter [Franzmannia pantelleriensis]|uniref:MFS transporter, FHS family, glucose/mannose:H+ symporter n=1 Tax=Franzmannia pantelleriensis TaxID=48727 RepID=A0A1G9I553_9GAMM|nr:MFS transporter [Halomonas pantelleriensis]SDL19994.1 MFS transporter, FHS family, glucose/mannose:H+ symporter [Halomonas pantelleriensis]
MLNFPSRHHRQVTLCYFLLFLGVGMTGGLLGPALPHLAAMTDSSMSQIAILFTARALGNMSGAFVTGLLMDRLNGHRVLIGMLLLTAAGLTVAPLSPTLGLLTGLFLLLGFAEVSLNSGANTLLLWRHRDAAGPHVSALHFCFGLGNMLVPLVMVAALAISGQFQWAFWVVAAYLLAMLWPLSRLRSPSKLASDEDATPRTPKHRDPVLLALFMLLFALYVGVEITFAGWITAYGVLTGLTAERAALLVTLFWMALSAGRLLAIPLLRWCSPWAILIGCLLLGIITALALHAVWLPLTLGALLFGLAASAIFPTLFSLGNQVMDMSGRTTGLIFTAAGSGALVVPSLTGPLLDLAGAEAFPPLLGGMLVLLGLGLVALHLRLSRLAQRQATT